MNDASENPYRKTARIGSMMALATIIALGASVCPTDAYQGGQRDHGNSSRRMSSSDIRRAAMINGYSEGYEDGVAARNDRRSLDYQNNDSYRTGEFGFESRWGDSRTYQAAFRDGYKRGYTEGFNGRNRNRTYDRSRLTTYYPNGYPTRYRNSSGSDFTQRSTQQGYYDGFYRGQYDRGQGIKRPNPQGHGAYEFALNGWTEEMGNQGAFQQAYRQYFLEGYQDGYGNRAFRQNYRP
jgi:hypothetical protein